MNKNKTTITDDRISDMMAIADATGDRVMAAICCQALDGWGAPKRLAALSAEERAIVAQFPSQDAARAECARVWAHRRWRTYVVHTADTDYRQTWMNSPAVLDYRAGPQDSGRCAFWVVAHDPAALETALIADEDVIEFEVIDEPADEDMIEFEVIDEP